MAPRSILLVLAGPSAAWPGRLTAWSRAGTIAAAVRPCRSAAQLHARLAGDPGADGVLLDGDLSVVDRGLVTDVSAAGAFAVVVEGTRRRRPWSDLGAAAVLPAAFDRRQLAAALHAVPRPRPAVPAPPADGPLVAVTGPGGTGASTVAIAVAQGLAATHRRVVLIDCCLRAEQAMLHDLRGPGAGLLALVDLHGERTPTPDEVRALSVDVANRSYGLLTGLPRPRHWALVPPGSVRPALRSARRAFDAVVADVAADVEGEAEAGSADVEDRNALARTTIGTADLVLVVGQGGMKGVHAVVRTVADLLELGVEPHRLLPVVNRAPAARSDRAALARTIAHLLDGVPGGRAVEPVLHAPGIAAEDALRAGRPLPASWSALLAGAVLAVLERAGRATGDVTPVPVAPGVLGHWDDDGPHP